MDRGVDRQSGLVAKLFAAAMLVLLAAASVLSGLERLAVPLPAKLSCSLAAPASCMQDLAARRDHMDSASFLEQTGQLARLKPAHARVQALHAAALAETGDETQADLFFRNSARLGWREKTGQIYSYLAAVEYGEVERAIVHLDVLIRLDRNFLTSGELLQPILENEDLGAAFAGRMAQNPVYLRSLLNSLVTRTTDDWPLQLRLLEKAREAGLVLSPSVSRPLLAQVFWRDPWQAVELWVALAGEGDWSAGSLAWDVSGRTAVLADPSSPFVWQEDGRRNLVQRKASDSGVINLVRAASGPTERLAWIAVPLREGRYPMRWRQQGKPGALFLLARCQNGDYASISRTISSPAGDQEAILQVDPGCSMPIIGIHKASGNVAAGAAISDISIGGAALLD